MTDSTQDQDRPATLSRRPKPAADETVDPVTYTFQGPAAPATEAATTAPTAVRVEEHVAAVGRRGRREVTFPFSTRLSQDIQEILDAAVAREGITVREATEQAIRNKWGTLVDQAAESGEDRYGNSR